MFKVTSNMNRDGTLSAVMTIDLENISFEKLVEIQNTIFQALDADDKMSLKQNVLDIFKADGFGGKIGMIKAYRQKTGAGLYEAKAWVEDNFTQYNNG